MTVRLDSESVSAVFNDCVSDEGDIEVDAIIGPVRFDKQKVADYAESIAGLLMELPEEFRETGGGGWSFLNACNDRHGQQWTGLHAVMAQLFSLGQAAGMVTCQLPREVWDALPGGMPYYVINDRSVAPAMKAAAGGEGG